MTTTKTLRSLATPIVVSAVAIGLLAGAYVVRAPLDTLPVVGSTFTRLGWPHDHGVGPYWSCPMHPEVHTHGPGVCPVCGMALERADTPRAAALSEVPSRGRPGVMADPSSVSAGARRVEVQIDPRRQQLIGVRTTPVERRVVTREIRAVGTVRYDETRLADVNVKVAGWIEALHVDTTGQRIEAGQPLFTLYSPELWATQQEYLLALGSREQLRGSAVPEADDYADRLVEAARQRLTLWDLPDDEIRALEASREPRRTLLFRSPVAGYVIEKRALRGQHVTPGASLYTVADLSEVWVEADLYEDELSLVREGAPATVTIDALPDTRFRGSVSYIYPYVEERTRTVRVRLALPNPRGQLKPGMYANVALDIPLGGRVVVPTNAVLDSGAEQYVFVAAGDGYFEPRSVTVGRRLGDVVEILGGLTDGTLVATSATFFLDSESQLRASLAGFEAPPPIAGGDGSRPRFDITYGSRPDPPRSGRNDLEVTVRDPTGQSVTDAEVSVVFSMAAMPTMNMPAMQSEAALIHQGGGVYRGEGEVPMAGRWDVTVLVRRDGQRLDSVTRTVVAR